MNKDIRDIRIKKIELLIEGKETVINELHFEIHDLLYKSEKQGLIFNIDFDCLEYMNNDLKFVLFNHLKNDLINCGYLETEDEDEDEEYCVTECVVCGTSINDFNQGEICPSCFQEKMDKDD